MEHCVLSAAENTVAGQNVQKQIQYITIPKNRFNNPHPPPTHTHTQGAHAITDR